MQTDPAYTGPNTGDPELDAKLTAIARFARRYRLPQIMHARCSTRMREGHAANGNDWQQRDRLAEALQELEDAPSWLCLEDLWRAGNSLPLFSPPDGRYLTRDERRAVKHIRAAWFLLYRAQRYTPQAPAPPVAAPTPAEVPATQQGPPYAPLQARTPGEAVAYILASGVFPSAEVTIGKDRLRQESGEWFSTFLRRVALEVARLSGDPAQIAEWQAAWEDAVRQGSGGTRAREDLLAGQQRVSCETCGNNDRGCKRPEGWTEVFWRAGGHKEGTDCGYYDPDPRARRAGVPAMEVRDEH